MAIFRRMQDVIRARLNELLDEKEDPQVRIDGMIEEMERSVVEMRRSAAAAIAGSRLAEKNARAAREQVAAWEKNATEAVRRGEDDLARRALLRKFALEERATRLEARATDAGDAASNMKDLLSSADAGLQDVKTKRDLLLSRMRTARAQGRVREILAQFEEDLARSTSSAEDLLGTFDEFSRWEEGVERMTAEIEAAEELTGVDLQRQFERMAQKESLERELSAIRKKVRGSR